jgi:trans-2,3-dihydro-3-hydroxyanthranilate isomerase
MAQFEMRWIDAFTTTPLAGNACAVVLDARGLDAQAMQAIARETNLSETAFVFPGDGEADFVVRYWTPNGEIPLAGHPTIATTHALCETGAIAADREIVRLRMPAALVPVTISRGTGSPSYAMSQPPPIFLDTVAREAAAAALRLHEDDLLAGTTPQIVSTGTPQLMIALASRDALDRCEPDRHALFPAGHPWFSVHVFARGEGEAALVARHFADFGDVAEDPFTGSATGGMAAYCARYGIVRERAYVVHQGAHVHRPGRAEVSIDGEPPDAIGRISVAGHAVTVMRATLTV